MTVGERRTMHRAAIALASDHEYFVIDRIIDAYGQAGFAAEFIGWNRRVKHYTSATYRGIQCRYIMRGVGYANWKLLLALPLWCVRLFWELLWDDADVIHAIDFDCAFPAALAGLFREKKIVYDIQDNFEERHSFARPLKAVLRCLSMWVARRCDEIIVTDENRIIGGLEDFRHKITIVGNCPPDFHMGRERYSRPGELVVGAFGVHLTSMRGIGLLIDASARVPGVRVLMAGRIVEPHLDEKIRSATNVEYLGLLPQDDVLRRIGDVDAVFAFYDPSVDINRRASSAKWYDAMMGGCPVISNREIMNSSWIEQEGFGFICDYSERSLVTLLTWLRDHLEERAQAGVRARRLFESRFNREAMNHKVADAARRAIGLNEEKIGETINV